MNKIKLGLFILILFSLFFNGCDAQFSRTGTCSANYGGQCLHEDEAGAGEYEYLTAWMGNAQYADGFSSTELCVQSNERCYINPNAKYYYGGDLSSSYYPYSLISAGADDWPLEGRHFACGNGVCEVKDGETGDWCPEDCNPGAGCYYADSCQGDDEAIFWFSFDEATDGYGGSLINGHLSISNLGGDFDYKICCGVEAFEESDDNYALQRTSNSNPSNHLILWGNGTGENHVSNVSAAGDSDQYLRGLFDGSYDPNIVVDCEWLSLEGEGEVACQEEGYDSCLLVTDSLDGDGHMASCIYDDAPVGFGWDSAYPGYDNKYCCSVSCPSGDCNFGTPIDDDIVDECTTDEDCASGEYCQDGECTACLPLASSCSNSFECCSGICLGGTCRGSNPPWILDKKALPPSLK